MRYKIQNIIVLEELENETVHDIVYLDLNEQEFLVKYLQNPDVIYWAIHDDGTRDFYRKGKHMVSVDIIGNITNIPGIK